MTVLLLLSAAPIVHAQGLPLIILMNPALPSGTVGNYYALSMAAIGGVAPYTWSIIAGNLPPGMAFTTTGLMEYAPVAAGDFVFTAQVTDSAGTTAAQDFLITVQKATPYFLGVVPDPIPIGTKSIVLGGQIKAGQLIPTGTVSITLGAITQTAEINSITGSFSAKFDTSTFIPANSPYNLSYSYAGNANIAAINFASFLTVTPALVTVTTADVTVPQSPFTFTIALQATLAGLPVVTIPVGGTALQYGSVSFQIKDGTLNIGTAVTAAIQNLTSASCSYTLPAELPAKDYTIEADYVPAGPNIGAAVGIGTLTISPTPPPTIIVSLPSASGVSKVTNGTGSLLSGYGTVFSTTPSSPAAIANFSVVAPTSAGQTLITEVGIPASAPALATRVFVDYSSSSDSGIALVNPGGADISIQADLKSNSGTLIGSTKIPLPAKNHSALFVSKLFPGMPNPFLGSLTLTCHDPFMAANLSLGVNGRQEILYYALPTINLNTQLSTIGEKIIPQVVDGGGMKTEIVLMNPSGIQQIVGTVSFFDTKGAPLALDFGALSGPQTNIAFSLPPDGVATFRTLGAGSVKSGHARVAVSSGVLPESSAVFQVWQNSQLVSLAGISNAAQTTDARLFVQSASTPRFSSTGMALVNSSPATANVALALTGANGTVHTTSLTIPPNSQVTKFITEVFPGQLPADYSGVLEVSSTQKVAITTLRMSINERREIIYSTLPLIDLTVPPQGVQYLAQFANGAGYATEVFLINTSDQNGQSAVTMFDEKWNPLGPTLFK